MCYYFSHVKGWNATLICNDLFRCCYVIVFRKPLLSNGTECQNIYIEKFSFLWVLPHPLNDNFRFQEPPVWIGFLSFACSIFPLAAIDDEINSEVKEIERMKKEIFSKELNVFSLKRKKQEYHSQSEEIQKRLKSWESALTESDPTSQSNKQ